MASKNRLQTTLSSCSTTTDANRTTLATETGICVLNSWWSDRTGFSFFTIIVIIIVIIVILTLTFSRTACANTICSLSVVASHSANFHRGWQKSTLVMLPGGQVEVQSTTAEMIWNGGGSVHARRSIIIIQNINISSRRTNILM